MTRKRRRLIAVLGGLALLGTASGLVLDAFSDNLVFFYSPTDLHTKAIDEARRMRIGGLVETGSVKHESDGKTILFSVTDGKYAVPVTYGGALPDLFREGQGVVIEGKLGHNGVFHAASVLAKHDERYMPPEVAAALKKTGHWQGEHPTADAAAAPVTR
jgi:cytochrome c-type biogenesis protein CcmE